MARDRKPVKSKGGRPSREQAAEINGRILSAATTLFLKRGVDGTSLEAIAAAAQIGKPTLYARYPDKSALFAAVIRAQVDAAMPPITGVAETATPAARLRQVGRAVIEGAMKPVPLGLMRLYIAEAPRHGALIREVDRLGRQAALEAIAGALAGAGGADAIDRAHVVAAHFLDMVFVPHQMRALLGDVPDEADPLHPTLDARIETAIAAFKTMHLLPAE
ncbi:TetR/AcrR family transcriptional regulator [Mesobaculum littorinae]|uniref:TetR/AcrR family transcriptional regulator n=1 Tax=Mesobaculum littorinae TaxID=2486419 RepID=A0A438AGV1_9RHOB|nr:TetR/AcrR family transcriptional regulator [Mesobaculum littorinae]RVV97922.1 TetR/AcrR family transcriptional regulator [Mesobaculum littorinae]